MRLLLPILAAAFLAAASPASAAPTWLTPVTVSPTSFGNVTATSVASDDAGHVVAVWSKLESGTTDRIERVLRSPGTAFTPAATISTPGVANLEPDVGIDAGGTATVVWQEASTTIRVRRIGPDGALSPLGTLSTAPASKPRVAVAPSGAAVAVWEQGNQVFAATRSTADGEFSPAAAIGLAGTVTYTRVAIDAGGNAVAAWIRDGVVEANRRPAGGDFRAPAQQDTVGSGATSTLALALSPDGRATALWDFTGGVIRTANRTISPSFADGTWSAASQASPEGGTTASTPSLAVDAQDTAIAVWRTTGANPIVQSATRLAGASFTNYQPLSGAGTGFASQVDVAPDGAAVAIWVGLSGARPAVQAARRPAGGAFGAVTDISLGDNASDPTEQLFGASVAVDDQGNAAGFWSRFRQSNPFPGAGINDWRVDAAGFDAAPPTLTAVSVPASASARAGVGMAAAATDRWTGSAIAWSFGDGTGAPGDAVTHAFGKSGAFDVTATATDGVGNAAAATRRILITAPSAPRRIDSTVQSNWGFDRRTKKRFYLLRLKVVAPPKGAAAQLRCRGKRCRFQSRRFTKRRKNAITLYKLVKPSKVVKKKSRRFHAGQKVQLRITAPGFTGKVVTWRLKQGKQPIGKVRCLPEGTRKPRKC